MFISILVKLKRTTNIGVVNLLCKIFSEKQNSYIINICDYSCAITLKIYIFKKFKRFIGLYSDKMLTINLVFAIL